MAKKKIIFYAVCAMVLMIINPVDHPLAAVEISVESNTIIPDMARHPPVIDGDLAEEVWQNPGLNPGFTAIKPVFGSALPFETHIWAAYDRENLYFAFLCYDAEPQKVKASISRRDSIFNDDYVSVLLDTIESKQGAFEFCVNPRGIQGDYLFSAVSGKHLEPDFVWESAGKITPKGYQVEIRIPLESIRFKKGKKVTMGIVFFRNISRLGVLAAWPPPQPGRGEFNYMTEIEYRELESPLKFEILPNFTYSRSVRRDDLSGEMGDPQISRNIGAALKYGITSSLTAEVTVNPDFSQVESDAFQMEVNQRYPLFYNEKRPFFMEGTDIFDFGLIWEGMMVSAVHTRNIVNPAWAAKVSGSAGKTAFAVLAADDRVPANDEKALFAVSRASINLGEDNSIGFLYSGRWVKETGSRNHAFGTDFQYRFFKTFRLTFSYLATGTRETENEPYRYGNGWNAMVMSFTPRFNFSASYERYDRDFFMASAFIKRTGIQRTELFAGPQFYTKIKGMRWLKKINPYFLYYRLHDLETQMDDRTILLGWNLDFTRQGLLWIDYKWEKESWAGREFNKKNLFTFAKVQLFKWLYLEGIYSVGDGIYYDPLNPCLGKGHTISFSTTIQPNERLSLKAEYLYSKLYKKDNKQELYSGDIYNLGCTFQFNRYFFLRGILRFDNFEKKLLTDFLASFTLVPGTVVYLGYGMLHEKGRWQGSNFPGGNSYRENFLKMKEGIFFKISYLWRVK